MQLSLVVVVVALYCVAGLWVILGVQMDDDIHVLVLLRVLLLGVFVDICSHTLGLVVFVDICSHTLGLVVLVNYVWSVGKDGKCGKSGKLLYGGQLSTQHSLDLSLNFVAGTNLLDEDARLCRIYWH